MANAIKKISVQRGYDVTRYALNCFGGAGGQHACLVADALGMTKVLIHPFSSLLSAYGMGLADIRATRQQAIEEPFGEAALAALAKLGERLGAEARRRSRRPGRAGVRRHDACARARPLCGHRHARCVGRRSAPLAEMKTAFEAAHKARFGFIDEAKQLVVEAVSVEAVGGGAKFAEPVHAATTAPLPAPARTTRFYSGGRWHEAAVFTRDQLAPGHEVAGPAIIIEPHQTVVVEDGWQAELTAKNHLVLARVVAARGAGTRSAPRPIR